MTTVSASVDTGMPIASSVLRAVGEATSRDLFVLVNGRASSTGEAGRWLADVRGMLGELGARVEARVTASEPELRDALQRAEGRRVVLVGGDGTLNAAVNAGVELREVALIPAGRANNVARALHIPLDPRSAARIAALAPARPLDLLRVEVGGKVRYAVEGLSAGL